MSTLLPCENRTVEGASLRVISLGAGVQSSVLALLAECGELGPLPDCAIFADTQWEPAGVYENLDWLEQQLSFPVYRVSAGDIRKNHLDGRTSYGQRFASMPLFVENGGLARRQCTKEYKIEPIGRKIRELLGVTRLMAPIRIEQWLGISRDELQRCKENRNPAVVHRWPLIEAGMSRRECKRWFGERYPGRPLVRSACIGCPFSDDARWRDMRDNQPEEFSDAVEFDQKLRSEGGRLTKMEERVFLHRSLQPLGMVDLDTDEDRGQMSFLDAECDGLCGT